MAKSNLEYWETRMLEQEERCNAKSLEYLSRLKIEYKAGQREIERQLKQYYEKYATENGMQPAQLRRNMKPEEWKDYQKQIEELLRKTGKAKERAARNRYLSGRISRLQALQNQAELEVELISKSHDISMLRHLQETYEDSYYHNAYYGAKAGIHARFDKLNPRMVEEICKVPWSGKSFSERIWGNTNKLKLEVRRLLSTGSICGTPLQVLSKRLSNRMEVSYHRAATLVRTESAHIREEATFDSYKKMGVERYRILATLDTRTSAICQSMDGKEFAYSDKSVGETYPPFHPNCRTTTVPVVEDFSFSDTRAAKDKEDRAIEVPKDMTYSEWYETYIAPSGTKNAGHDIIKLTRNEEQALNQYISSGSYVLNEKLRSHTSLSKQEKTMAEYLDMALEKMPYYEGHLSKSLYFGNSEKVEAYLDTFRIGKNRTFEEFFSTTKGVDLYNPEGEVQIYIWNGKKGKDVSGYNPEEQEVLYPRGSIFFVENIVEQGGKWYILLREDV